MYRTLSFIAIVITLLQIVACRNADTVTGALPSGSTSGVYIVNEGGFSGGGSLSYYDKLKNSISNNIVGVAQQWIFPNDMKIVGGKGYVAVNGLDRIDVVDLASSQVTRSIQFSPSSGPGFLTWGDSLIEVANYNGTMSVVNTRNDSLIWTSQTIVGFPGGIISVGNKIFISDVGSYPSVGSTVKVLDVISRTVIDSIRTPGGPGSMTVMNGKLFVVCTDSARIFQIDPVTDLTEDSIQLSGYLGDIVSNNGLLFVLNSDSVSEISVGPLHVMHGGLVKRTDGLYFYALGIDDTNGDLYVSNITSSGGAGEIEIFTSSGFLKVQHFPVGIFPGAFAFRHVF